MTEEEKRPLLYPPVGQAVQREPSLSSGDDYGSSKENLLPVSALPSSLRSAYASSASGGGGGQSLGSIQADGDPRGLSRPWYKRSLRQLWRQYATSQNLLSLLLLFFVIAFGTANRVVYKIQLIPMNNYVLFISWVITVAYCFIYFGMFFINLWMGRITRDMVRYVPTCRGTKLIFMGLMDALGFVLGIFAARKLTGFLLTLLPQGIIPMTMVVAAIWLKARYHWGQLLSVAILVGGLIVSLIPDLKHAGTGDDGWLTIVWSVVYVCSTLPNAISFVLKEKVWVDVPNMNIFVVNSFDSLWQLIFSILLFPIILIPGFGKVSADELGNFIPHGAKCLVGITPTKDDDCSGEPWLMLIYVTVNLSWNISLLLLLKKGGAVFTFIGAAISLPLSHLAFAIPWPIKGKEELQWVDIIALLLVFVGLVSYKYFTMKQKEREKQRKAKTEVVVENGDDYSTLHVNDEDAFVVANQEKKRD
ncbi:Transmembrane protein [Balamuthia mandrillaris]